jgi:hypothetical protein
MAGKWAKVLDPRKKRAMSKKPGWKALTHEQRIQVLATMTVEQILDNYELPNSDLEDFRERLLEEISLWTPGNLGRFQLQGGPPTKDVVLGAWRDLDRPEALLELIDNSIDAWNLRRATHPARTAPRLMVRIWIDPTRHQLMYEDNAGGVPLEKLNNLVVPGYSDTTDLTATIGSYRTGGKKAIFRLATAASITTRYWNPVETSDEAWSIQLDEAWLRSSLAYEFPVAPLKDRSAIEKGQTRYTFQLREEPIGGTPWYLEPDNVKKVTDRIQQTYTLLLIRNPSIEIYFLDLEKPIKALDDLYDFSGTNHDGTNLQPQQVQFVFQMQHEGVPHQVTAEIILGCRRTSGTGHSASQPGIDLYGNNRQFVLQDQETLAPLLPGGNAGKLVRGLVNVHGPNVFIPWDTHKHHLNPDRDILRVLTKNKLITDFFRTWKDAYQAVALGDGNRLISERLPRVIDTARKDLFIPTRVTIPVDLARKRGVSLPADLAPPSVSRNTVTNGAITINFTVDAEEARLLFGKYGIVGSPDDVANTDVQTLTEAIREEILGRDKNKRKR